jgi:transposase
MGLEACSGAHFLGRALRAQGHDVRLIPAQFVKPFVKSNKNDFLDAEAIAEAVARQNMRFVPIKTDDQLDLQAIHRVRYRPRLRRSRLHQSPRRRLQEMSLRSRPENVRELKNVVERSVIVSPDDVFCVDEAWLSTGSAKKRSGQQVPEPADGDSGRESPKSLKAYSWKVEAEFTVPTELQPSFEFHRLL